MIRIKNEYWLVILINIFALGVAAVNSNLRLILLTLVLWADLVVYTLYDLKNRCTLLAFLISMFTFLIGREALEKFGLHSVDLPFPQHINQHAELLVLLSLVFFMIGYAISGSKKKKEPVMLKYDSDKYRAIRYVSKILFYATYSFNLFVVLDVVYFVFTRGYTAFYNSYVSHVPYILKKIGDMSPILFWIFLSTFPRKKECKYPVIFYVLYLCLSLGTGSRFVFVAGVLTLFCYFMIRNNNNQLAAFFGESEVWISKKHLVIAALFVPVMIIGMFFINLIRFHKSTDVSLMDAFTGFFYGQGVSICFIKRAKMYENLLPSNKWYMFGKLLDFLSDNIIARSLGATTYSGNSVDQAIYGNQMSHALSYRIMGSHYLQGHGLGSSYVAELFHDLGYFGVACGNLLYGIIFRRVFRFENKGIWNCAICFFMLNSLMHAGRGNFDSFIVDVLDMTTWGTIFVVYIGSKMYLAFMHENDQGVLYIKKETVRE